MGLIPDRWLKYSPVGAQIEGTRFIAFKVPLDNLDLNATKETQGIDVEINDMINTKIMFERIPNLGLVIDLTNTKKYYNSKNVTDLGIEYKKIFVPGQRLPGQHIYDEFMSTVTDFLRRNAENDKLIGVHCTHGLNRTGLMICAHMIQNCNIPPIEAISRFDTARGHKMERENYLEALRNMTAEQRSTNEICSPSEMFRHGNLRSVSTQTNYGVWLDTKKPKKRKREPTDTVEDVKNIKGTVHVDGSNLISDGCGGYYMRVNLSDVRPFRNSDTHGSHRSYGNYGAPRNANIGQDPCGSYYANQSIPNHSNHYRPNPNGTFYSNQFRQFNDRFERRNDDRNATFGPSFQKQKYFNDSSDLFK